VVRERSETRGHAKGGRVVAGGTAQHDDRAMQSAADAAAEDTTPVYGSAAVNRCLTHVVADCDAVSRAQRVL